PGEIVGRILRRRAGCAPGGGARHTRRTEPDYGRAPDAGAHRICVETDIDLGGSGASHPQAQMRSGPTPDVEVALQNPSPRRFGQMLEVILIELISFFGKAGW